MELLAKAESALLLIELDTVLPQQNANDVLRALLVGFRKGTGKLEALLAKDESAQLLSELDAVLPRQNVNDVLRALLVGVRRPASNSETSNSGQPMKQRRTRSSEGAQESVPIPWKPRDGLPTNKC